MAFKVIPASASAEALTALAASFRNTTDLDTGAAPTPGLVYRSTGTANAVTEAQADSAANAAGIVGIGDSVMGLRPITMPGAITFDSLPVVGQIAYLSATVAGQATCTAPAVTSINQPLGTVDRVVSAIAPFRAYVIPLAVSGHSVLVQERLMIKAAAELGGSTDDYYYHFDHFDKWVRDGETGLSTLIGWDTLVNPSGYDWRAQMLDSYANMGPGMRAEKQFTIHDSGYFGPLCGRPWMIAFKFRMSVGNATSCVVVEMSTGTYGEPGTRQAVWLYAHGSGAVCVGHGGSTCMGGALPGAPEYSNAWTKALVGTIAMSPDPGAGDAHVCYLRSLGDGTYQGALDSGAYCAPIAFNPNEVLPPDPGAGVRAVIGDAAIAGSTDWFFYAVHE